MLGLLLFSQSFSELLKRIEEYPAFVKIPAEKLPKSNKDFLAKAMADAVLYFLKAADVETGLVMDCVGFAPRKIVNHTSPTNIGFQLAVYCAAYDMGVIKKQEALRRIKKILASLKKLEKWNNFFFNYYFTDTLKRDSTYVSTVDNAWLTCGLVTVANYFPELAKAARSIYRKMDWRVFYDAKLGQFYHGFYIDKNEYTPWRYGVLCTESRIISYVAIGKGDVAEDHWFRVYRTLPIEWTWQRQQPQGYWAKYMGVDVFEGWYEWEGIRIVPSWGGSLYEFLLPVLFVDELKYAPRSLGENDRRAVEAHILFAQKKGYPVWGFVPCSVPDGRYGGYHGFGVPYIGSKGYEENDVVAPYASALALCCKPKEAIENLKKLASLGVYGPWGFYDSYDVEKKLVSPNYFAQNQAILILGIYNYLSKGKLRKAFHKEFPAIATLLGIEEFGFWR